MANLAVGGKPICVVRPTVQTSSQAGTQPTVSCANQQPTPPCDASNSTCSSIQDGRHRDDSRPPFCVSSCSKCNRVEPSSVCENYAASCSFYFRSLSAAQANRLLSKRSVGTFLLRDSSDRRFAFALTVQTPRGPTSVRIARTTSGFFCLDSSDEQRNLLPQFDDVMRLIRHYCRPTTNMACMFLEKTGRADTPIVLTRPLDVAMSRDPLPLATLCQRTLNSIRLDRKESICVDCYADSLPVLDERSRKQWRQSPFDFSTTFHFEAQQLVSAKNDQTGERERGKTEERGQKKVQTDRARTKGDGEAGEEEGGEREGTCS